MTKYPMLHVYQTDFGPVILPDDFPAYALRILDALPDLRFSIADDVARYIDDVAEGARQIWESGRPVYGQRGMSWAEWRSS